MNLQITLLLLCVASGASAQSIAGRWKTIDDETGKARSMVEIYERDGKMYGKIVQLFRAPDEDQNPTCTKCSGKEKDQPVIGMQIINGLKYSTKSKDYSGGSILDPESGKVYDCKLWLEDGKLKVRGYILFLYRTQTWHKA
jgi:uncharacterized protein (DUF2147 family)